MGASWMENLRRLSSRLGSPFVLPTMTTADEGTWFELRPGGVPAVGVANPKRWADQAQAEEAAGRLLIGHPGFDFVEIITYEIRDGRRSPVTSVGRV